MDFQTLLIHGGENPDDGLGDLAPPIHVSSTYAQADPERFGPYTYARSGNPTRTALEAAIAALEGGARGLAFASGMAAIASTLLLFAPGDHLIVCRDLYGGAYRVLTGLFARWGLETSFVDTADLAAVARAVTPRTRAVYVESPSNPLLAITDLAAVAGLAKAKGLTSIVDNTFMTPYLQRPLALGFDIVVHSATKFLGGHSDLVAGLAVTADAELGLRLAGIQNAFGAVLPPLDSWLLLRGLRTLAVRLAAEQATAGELAAWLAGRDDLARVHYPGLAGHPGQDIHRAQADGPGAVLSFELQSPAAAKAFMRALTLPKLAVSLGGVESILSYPATMSHAAMPAAERAARGISDALVRLSVGLESAADLKADLDRALAAARARPAP
ncbi:trans-sulfuration enzyme family protein [Solidesulfovibrio sp.]|uniref:trans-sulfuration enzyme family protein n=1 Tax=Solidesulfovibrio sp. TaxID=2910990 RepID=UPI002B21D63A|nr:aminotransferase class I/II-fold pyridoxal phosphate-dependent enzyme [Solidesulfovibrio sp.]MEA4856712.1 aminotransferase class I/II-fold pyridoxal phosphate-dependent enzyme [Solidesulfovibrio sp.]